MPQYSYRAKDKQGKLVEGLVQAETAGIAQDILDERGFEVVSLEPAAKMVFNIDFSLSRVHIKDLVIFSRQLAVLISAKVPAVKALRNTVRQTENKKLKIVIAEIADDVEGGKKLSDALAGHSKHFSDFFINIIKSGETSGRLDEVLNYLADQMEKDYELNSRIKGALIYPAFIISAMFILGMVMMIFVVPRLTEMLVTQGVELPLSTRILIGTSNLFVNYWYLIIIALAGIIIGGRLWLKTSAGKEFIDRLLLKLPIFGKLLSYVYIVRMTRSLKTLLQGGVNLVEALEIVSRVPGNEVYRQMIMQTKAEVEDGNSIAAVFSQSKNMPQMVPQMLATGEETGQMNQVLDKLADFYTREVTNIVSNLMSLLEPVIMVLLGVAVGVMVAAIILPMYKISMSM